MISIFFRCGLNNVKRVLIFCWIVQISWSHGDLVVMCSSLAFSSFDSLKLWAKWTHTFRKQPKIAIVRNREIAIGYRCVYSIAQVNKRLNKIWQMINYSIVSAKFISNLASTYILNTLDLVSSIVGLWSFSKRIYLYCG